MLPQIVEALFFNNSVKQLDLVFVFECFNMSAKERYVDLHISPDFVHILLCTSSNNPEKLAENLGKSMVTSWGVRPGERYEKYTRVYHYLPLL